MASLTEEKVLAVLQERLDCYGQKLAQADPFAHDDRNRYDALRYVIEALEIVADELGVMEAMAANGYDKLLTD